MNYEDMLDRAYDDIEKVKGENDVRLEIPEPDTQKDGSYTVFHNFSDTADVMNRDESELLTYLKEQMATSGSIDNKKARFKGSFSENKLSEYIDQYLENFVKCEECGSPDTKYVKRAGVEIIKCTACGASNPKPET